MTQRVLPALWAALLLVLSAPSSAWAGSPEEDREQGGGGPAFLGAAWNCLGAYERAHTHPCPPHSDPRLGSPGRLAFPSHKLR